MRGLQSHEAHQTNDFYEYSEGLMLCHPLASSSLAGLAERVWGATQSREMVEPVVIGATGVMICMDGQQVPFPAKKPHAIICRLQ